MQIVGAVLDRTGAPPPYATSGALRATTLELDPPGPGELLVRIEAAGLCHSDLSVVDGSRERPVPMLLGHEAAGIVEAVGAGSEHSADDADGEPDGIVPGRRVVLTFLPRCGTCAACATDGRLPCSVGSAANAAGTLVGGAVRLHRGPTLVHHHLGASAFATHAVVHRTSVVPVDDDVPADVAALLGCAVLTGGGAVVNAGRPAPGDRVAVVGLGGVGMAALLVARALGHEVLGVDPVPAKLDLARNLGATACTPTEALDAALDGGERAPVVVEAAGSARAFETALALTAPGGTTVTAGLPGPDARASVAPLTLTAEARTVVGSYLGSSVPRRDIPRYIDLWRAGRLPLESLVSARIGLEDLPTALDQLAAGAQLRQLITFDERNTA
ncbi:zinc-binding dehydrogenase [Isoptericola sp. NPDC019482]|uniref:zinc-binding dehydrogenase n=1 Tax=Isoptericola sp. NPDC019482 TaxID=3154688 RepID=UPI0034857EA9